MYTQTNYPLINLNEAQNLVNILQKSIHFQGISNNNWPGSNPYLRFHNVLDGLTILKKYYSLSFCFAKYLKNIGTSRKIEEIEKSYLDSRVELEMVQNFVFKDLLDAIYHPTIKFDGISDFFNSSKQSKKVDLVINKNNENRVKIECKRISESLDGEVKKAGITINKDLKIHSNVVLQQFNTVLIKKIEEKILANLPQLNACFLSGTCNIFYLCIEGDSTSVKSTKRLNHLLHDYINHYSNKNLGIFSSINLYGQLIDYIIIVFSDRRVILECNSQVNSYSIAPDHPTIVKIKQLLI